MNYWITMMAFKA